MQVIASRATPSPPPPHPLPAALIMIAKWPGSGKAKTRLAKRLAQRCANVDPRAEQSGRLAATAFATAAISDLLVRFCRRRSQIDRPAPGAVGRRFLLYAPADEESARGFAALFDEIGVADAWELLPVCQGTSARSADLGGILTDAATRCRREHGCGQLVFIGMDSPELTSGALHAALEATAAPRSAHVCPAADGGYTLLALSADAPAAAAFAGVHWSAADTCLSQLAVLSRAGLRCTVGETFADVDEIADLRQLDERISAAQATARRKQRGVSGLSPAEHAECCWRTEAFLALLRAGAYAPVTLGPPAPPQEHEQSAVVRMHFEIVEALAAAEKLSSPERKAG
jgi:glycosyltransferase A (GT-A) superfamily protein (DUF2064 family)